MVFRGGEEGEAQLRLRFAVVDGDQPRPARPSGQRSVDDLGTARDAPERLLREPHHLRVLERPGGAEDQVARPVRARVVIAQVVLAQSAHRLARAGDLLPERMSFEERPLGKVVDVDVAALLVDLVEDLLEDHLPLELDLLEERPRQHVAEHGERHVDPGGMHW